MSKKRKRDKARKKANQPPQPAAEVIGSMDVGHGLAVLVERLNSPDRGMMLVACRNGERVATLQVAADPNGMPPCAIMTRGDGPAFGFTFVQSDPVILKETGSALGIYGIGVDTLNT